MKKKVIFIFLVLIFGISVCYAAEMILGSNVFYDNSKSNLKATNVQDAIDELYDKTLNQKNIEEPISFAEDSWETIQNAIKTGNTDMYNVGDTKSIKISEHSNGSSIIQEQWILVRISNKEECTTETSETACGFVIEFVDSIEKYKMNLTATNVGGWKDSALRTYLNSTILTSLPIKLQNVISDTKVISGHGSTSGEENFETTDKLYLLSTKEVYGTSLNDTVDSETKQLEYYLSKGVTSSVYSEVIKKCNGSSYYWWSRTAYSNNLTSFMMFNYSNGSSRADSVTSSLGVSPAFRIG